MAAKHRSDEPLAQVSAVSEMIERLGPSGALTPSHHSQTTFRNAPLDRMILKGSFMGFDFSGSSLRRSVISGTYTYAKFDYADLRRADLRAAALNCASFKGSDLRDADLRRADLYGVGFSGADLTRAKLGGARIWLVVYDDATRWPGDLKAHLDAASVTKADGSRLVQHIDTLERSATDGPYLFG